MSSRPFGIAFQSQSQGYIQPVLWEKSSSVCLSRARKATASSCTMMPLNLNLRIRIYWVSKGRSKRHTKTKQTRCGVESARDAGNHQASFTAPPYCAGSSLTSISGKRSFPILRGPLPMTFILAIVAGDRMGLKSQNTHVIRAGTLTKNLRA